MIIEVIPSCCVFFGGPHGSHALSGDRVSCRFFRKLGIPRLQLQADQDLPPGLYTFELPVRNPAARRSKPDAEMGISGERMEEQRGESWEKWQSLRETGGYHGAPKVFSWDMG